MALTSTSSLPLERNYLGATIFWLYILAALYFSITVIRIILDIRSRTNRTEHGRTNSTPYTIIFSVLAFLSFATLSFNMLHVLARSFTLWYMDHHALLALQQTRTSGMGEIWRFMISRHSPSEISQLVWQWSITSTLFLDFATAILADKARMFWTLPALEATLGVCVYMGLQGARHRVPKLWAFFCLAEILPVSFTQNLFYLALLQSPAEPAQELTELAFLFVSPQTLYNTCLIHARQNVLGGRWFIPLVLAARALLMSPLALAYLPGQAPIPPEYRGRDVRWAWRLLLGGLSLSWAVMIPAQAWETFADGWTVREVWEALFADPAVTTLGCDVVLSGLSFVVWMCVRRPVDMEEFSTIDVREKDGRLDS